MLTRFVSPRRVGISVALVSCLASRIASADPVWTGDMEAQDLSEWSFVAHPENVTIVSDPILHGAYAAQIQLTNDAVWPNGLKRVELNHRPATGRTAEGATTFFAWSFYLPATLPTDPSQQIGYWESNDSYQQMMAFEVKGEDLTFSTRKPNNVVQWDAPGVVTAGEWHRIAIGIHFSKDAAQGTVDAWFDGTQVVTNASAQTLADDNEHFTQVGLLRGAIEFTDSPIMVIDDAVEGDTIDDVRPALPTTTSGAGGGSTTTTSSGATTTGAGGAGGSASSGAGGTGSSGGGSDDESGCAIGAVGGSAEGWGAAGLVLAGLAMARRRARCGR